MSETIDVKKIVLTSWETVFGADVLVDDANFFDLGGDSLAALEIAAGLYEGLGCPAWVEEDWLANASLEYPVLGENISFVQKLVDGGSEFVQELLRANSQAAGNPGSQAS